MIETYRMLGREHEADLEREAKKRREAALVDGKVTRRRFASLRRWSSVRTRAPAPVSRAEGHA
jgi:hypothetical protein